jgi:ribose transport system substrate-binding protein
MLRNSGRSLALLLAAAALFGLVAAGVATGSGQRSTAACGVLPFSPPKNEKGNVLSTLNLPAALREGYNNYLALLAKSPYQNFKPKHKPPWTIAYSNSFSGNAWRAAALASLQQNFAAAKKQGLVKGKLIVTDSNGKNDVQIQQMRSLIQQGVDIIFSIPASPTAMNGVIKQAFDAGIPVLTLSAPVDTEFAINVDTNQFTYGARQAQGLALLTGGKGTIMTVQGIPGTPGSLQIQSGGDAVLKSKACGFKIIANFGGSWNNATAKTEMLKALATHPQKLDAIWEQGSMEKGIIEALQQVGRPVPLVTMGNPDQAGLAYWRDHVKDGYQGVATAQPSAAGADAMFRIGMRVLEGRGLKVNAIVGNPPLTVDKKNVAKAKAMFKGVDVQTLDQWVKPGWTFNSAGVANPTSGPTGSWLNDAALDFFFKTKGSGYKGISNAGQ